MTKGSRDNIPEFDFKVSPFFPPGGCIIIPRKFKDIEVNAPRKRSFFVFLFENLEDDSLRLVSGH